MDRDMMGSKLIKLRTDGKKYIWTMQEGENCPLCVTLYSPQTHADRRRTPVKPETESLVKGTDQDKTGTKVITLGWDGEKEMRTRQGKNSTKSLQT